MSSECCLKWDNHLNVMKEFKNFLSIESMVDVTLACDGLSLKAHKLVLSACSPFFRSVFSENPCKHPIVILKDMKYTELKAIIDYMYCGEINIATDQLSALIKTARTLQVKGLGEVESPDTISFCKSHNPESLNQSSDESENEFVDESENQSSDEFENQSNDEFEIRSDCTEVTSNCTHMRIRSASNETVRNYEPKIKQEVEVLPGDMDTSSVPMHSHNSNHFNHYQRSHEKSFVIEESFQDSTLNKVQKNLPTNNLRRQSFQSSAPANVELHQNHSSNAPNLVSDVLTRVPVTLLVDCLKSGASSDPLTNGLQALAADVQKTKTSADPLTNVPQALAADVQKTKTSAVLSKDRPDAVAVEQQKTRSSSVSSHKKPRKRGRPRKTPSGKTLQQRNSQENKVINNKSLKSRNALDEIKNSKCGNSEVDLYECVSCSFKTRHQWNIKKHVKRVHPHNKPFKCKQCDFGTVFNHKLTRHIAAVHQKKRRHQCNLCAYKAFDRYEVKRHIRRVHEKIRYKCEKCDYLASENSRIKKHMIEAHEKK